MFEGLGAFLIVDSIFLLRGGGATNIFVVGGGASSTKDIGKGVFVFIFKVEVDS